MKYLFHLNALLSLFGSGVGVYGHETQRKIAIPKEYIGTWINQKFGISIIINDNNEYIICRHGICENGSAFPSYSHSITLNDFRKLPIGNFIINESGEYKVYKYTYAGKKWE